MALKFTHKNKGNAEAVTTVQKDKDESPEVATEQLGVVKNPKAMVGLELGTTINIGDYNSVRVSVSLQVPCEGESVENIDETYEEALAWVTAKLEATVEEVIPAD